MCNKVAVIVGCYPLMGNEGIECVKRFSEIPQHTTKDDIIRWLLEEVFPQANELGAVVVFQTISAQLAAAIAVLVKIFSVGNAERGYTFPRCGISITAPGERATALENDFDFSISGDFVSGDDPEIKGPELALLASKAVTFANPAAKVITSGNVLKVAVEVEAPFKFSHIEWLN